MHTDICLALASLVHTAVVPRAARTLPRTYLAHTCYSLFWSLRYPSVILQSTQRASDRSPPGLHYTASTRATVFHMEACIYDQVCSNRDSFWKLQPGEDWQCQLDYKGFEQFRDWVLLAR